MMVNRTVLTGALLALFASGVATGETGWRNALSEAGVEVHGFMEYRYGGRIQSDPVEDDNSLNDLRFQLDTIWYQDLATVQVKADLLYDDLADDRNHVNMETGRGYFDLRRANILFSPLSWMDVNVGRQALTWGTGDLVFINDLFPKDWQSFFLGRDDEYLKAPSDALFVSMFPDFAGIDIAYMPRFDADRHITGERLSFWNGEAVVGQDAVLNVDRPSEWFRDDEIAARVYRNVGSYEVALYGYYGFWKSPGGMDAVTGQWIFPGLSVYGGSLRGPVGSGIMNAETGYYDSREDRDGDDPLLNNSEARFLLGYEQELVRNLNVAMQYYVEHMMGYSDYLLGIDAMGAARETAREEDRHTVTLRLTGLLMNQNLVVSCFTRYSISEQDVYVKPSVTYKASDRWQASIGANLFAGPDEYTFLAQFEDNSNVHASLRYSF